jgi:hypothetical protein
MCCHPLLLRGFPHKNGGQCLWSHDVKNADYDLPFLGVLTDLKALQ